MQTIASVPEQPAALSYEIMYSTRRITLLWSKPEDNGSPLIAYELESPDGDLLQNSAALTLNGADSYSPLQFECDEHEAGDRTYRFRLRSSNSYGWSPWSVYTSVSTASGSAAPSRPSITSVTATGHNSATVVWQAGGGSLAAGAPDGYEIKWAVVGSTAAFVACSEPL